MTNHDRPRSPESADSAANTPSQLRANPYVGPRALREGERIFGRDRELREVLNRLIADRLVLLYSPSGAGKSSLVQAGLIPQMRKEKFSVLPIIRVGQEPPSELIVESPAENSSQPHAESIHDDKPGRFNRYVISSLIALDQELPAKKQQTLPKLAQLTFREYLAQRPRKPEEPSSRLLVFDQFEEILTQAPLDREGKLTFFEQLGEALLDHDLWALFVIREDFLAGLDPYLPLIPTYLRSTFRLDLLESQPALLAIQKPVEDQGIEFQDEAARKLVDDLSRVWVQQPDGSQREEPGLYVEPVQLQVVCRRLYRELGLDNDSNKNVISLDDVARLGDVNKALGEYYSGEVGEVAAQTSLPERSIRDWFSERLITENLLRGQVLMGEEKSGGMDNNVIRMLEDAHLLRAENRRNSTWFELAHDRLVRPILEDNQEWAETHLQEFQRRAAEWRKKDRPSALLLRGRDLLKAEEWAESHPDGLNDIDQELLKASQEWRIQHLSPHQRKADAWEREGHPQELLLSAGELTQAEAWLAEYAEEAGPLEMEYITASREAVAQQEFKRQRRTIWIAVTAVMAIGVVLLALFSVYQSRTLANESAAQAEKFSALAAENARQAEENARMAATIAAERDSIVATSTQLLTQVASSNNIAEALRGTSEALERQSLENLQGRATAEFNANLAQASRLALLAQEIVGSDPELSALLGIVAYQAFPQGWEGRNALLNSLLVKPLHAVRSHGSPIPTEVLAVQALAFSADGKLLAWCGRDGKVKVWDIEQERLVRELPIEPAIEPAYEINTLAFSPVDYNLLVSGSGIGYLDFWNLEAGTRDRLDAVYRLENDSLRPSGELTSLAFSPDGGTLAVSGLYGNVGIWDISQRTAVKSLNSGGAIVRMLDWSPDGSRLAGATTAGVVYIWDPVTGAREDLPRSEDDIKFALDWSPDGKWLAYAGGNQFNHRYWRDIRLYDTRTRDNIEIRNAALQNIRTLAFDQESRVLAVGEQDGTLDLYDVYSEDLGVRYPSTRLIETLFHGSERPFGRILAFASQGPNRLAYIHGDEIEILDIVSARPLNVEVAPALTNQDVHGVILATGFGPENEIRTLTQQGNSMTLSSIGSNTSISLPSGAVHSAAIGPADLVATGDSSGMVQVWDAQTRTNVWRTNTNGPVQSLAFSQSGENLAVSWCSECTRRDEAFHIGIYEIGSNGKPIELNSANEITSLALNWDGDILAGGGREGRIQLWDTQAQRQLGLDLLMGPYSLFRSGITALAFDREGGTLASGNRDGDIALWDIESRQQIGRTIKATDAPVTGLFFAPDGLSLTLADGDGIIQRWDLDPQGWIERLCILTDRDFTPEERQEYFPGQDVTPPCEGYLERPTGTPGPAFTPTPTP